MSAIERLKAESVEYPPVRSGTAPPMLEGASIPSALVQVLLELIERVEALEDATPFVRFTRPVDMTEEDA